MSELFNFSEIFKTGEKLFVYEDASMESIRRFHSTPVPYKSIEELKPVFDLDRNMYDPGLIEKLGGDEQVRKNIVTPDQIWQLIENQWGGKKGDMLTNGYANIFYVLGEDDTLFAVSVRWGFGREKWSVCVLIGFAFLTTGVMAIVFLATRANNFKTLS